MRARGLRGLVEASARELESRILMSLPEKKALEHVSEALARSPTLPQLARKLRALALRSGAWARLDPLSKAFIRAAERVHARLRSAKLARAFKKTMVKALELIARGLAKSVAPGVRLALANVAAAIKTGLAEAALWLRDKAYLEWAVKAARGPPTPHA